MVNAAVLALKVQSIKSARSSSSTSRYSYPLGSVSWSRYGAWLRSKSTAGRAYGERHWSVSGCRDGTWAWSGSNLEMTYDAW